MKLIVTAGLMAATLLGGTTAAIARPMHHGHHHRMMHHRMMHHHHMMHHHMRHR